MDLPPPLRDPSLLFYQQDALRRSIIAAYWIVIILALPLWWSTTSIKRLSLPSSRLLEQTQRRLELPITICLESNDSFVADIKQALVNLTYEEPLRWEGISVDVVGQADCASARNSYTIVSRDGAISIEGRRLYFPVNESNAAVKLASMIASLVVPYSFVADPDRRVAQYSPRYRLAFSLLNEDAATEGGVLHWDIQRGVKSQIMPILRYLEPLHNFTIESQVQFHAPLAFSPRTLENAFAVSPEDLTVFVNSAEWTLSSSSSNDPVLHFVLFIPSFRRRPLHLLGKDDKISPSNAFLLPQWGGIVIHNPQTFVKDELPFHDLDAIFSSFAGQLLSLLGVPLPPPPVKCTTDVRPCITDWQLDALLRRRTLENASGSQDTLLSIIKLVNQINNMPVGEDVRDDVACGLLALTRMYDSSSISLRDTFAYSVESLTLASRAFFNPGMLALLYFPAEHKYAVYTPLFASAVIPLFVAALREITAWRKDVKQRKPTNASVPASR